MIYLFIAKRFFVGVWRVLRSITPYGRLWILSFVLFGVMIGAAAFYAVKFAREARRERESQAVESQKRINEAKTQANQAAVNSNIALQNSNAARNKNINSFSGVYEDAMREYCKSFPEDCR